MRRLAVFWLVTLSACGVDWPAVAQCSTVERGADPVIEVSDAVRSAPDAESALAALEPLARRWGGALVACVLDQLASGWDRNRTGSVRFIAHRDAAAQRAREVLRRIGTRIERSEARTHDRLWSRVPLPGCGVSGDPTPHLAGRSWFAGRLSGS